MTTTFQVDADELDQKFLDRIKAIFRGKRVSIVVFDNDAASNQGTERHSNGALEYYMSHPIKFEGFPPFDREEIYRNRTGA